MPTPINYVFCPTIDLEYQNFMNVKLANITYANKFKKCVCAFCYLDISCGLYLGKPQDDLPTLVHSVPHCPIVVTLVLAYSLPKCNA